VYPLITRAEQKDIYPNNAVGVLDTLPKRGGRLLEIGCAGGFFLDEGRKRGFEVVGIELNATMATHARTPLGLNVIQGRIEDIESDSFRQNVDVARSVEPV
jgi:2-polyprenyl-3-methyl-5-hydroxy-6-metoxy-1,4-benzoquinol methylase